MLKTIVYVLRSSRLFDLAGTIHFLTHEINECCGIPAGIKTGQTGSVSKQVHRGNKFSEQTGSVSKQVHRANRFSEQTGSQSK